MSEPHYNRDELLQFEVFWRDHQKWLQESGYMLRPRYMPDWIPSWKTSDKPFIDCEDYISIPYSQLIDATRLSDNVPVALKRVQKSVHPHEVEIGTFFCTEPLSQDAQNHCIPIFEILQVPDDEDIIILAMPLLTKFDYPEFDTIGEAVDFFGQVFEGLQFMHRNHVAHRDCNGRNIMMQADKIFPDGFHPQATSMNRAHTGPARRLNRTQYPSKYYFIDFGLSRKYNLDNGQPQEPRIFGGDKTVPEFRDSLGPFDPFPTDVYYLGNMLKWYFIQGDGRTRSGYLNFNFMRSLANDMTVEDPTKRPTMDEVVERFAAIRNGLSSWKLRSRLVQRNEGLICKATRSLNHWKRRISFIVRRIPPIPVSETKLLCFLIAINKHHL